MRFINIGGKRINPEAIDACHGGGSGYDYGIDYTALYLRGGQIPWVYETLGNVVRLLEAAER